MTPEPIIHCQFIDAPRNAEAHLGIRKECYSISQKFVPVCCGHFYSDGDTKGVKGLKVRTRGTTRGNETRAPVNAKSPTPRLKGFTWGSGGADPHPFKGKVLAGESRAVDSPEF